MAADEKAQYDDFAPSYTSVVDLPCAKLEAELVRNALGDCKGLTILDLGGGSGIHARHAIDAGAATVDVFDISEEMLRMGWETEAKLGRQDRIRWFRADATKPLTQQTEPGSLPADGYDIVMVNWTFDNAGSTADHRGMWENALSYLKPNGRFLGVRLQNLRPAYMASGGKYGVRFKDFEDIPGGVKYEVECHATPLFTWGCTAMDSSSAEMDVIPRELGLVDTKFVNPEQTETVQNDLKFWQEFLQDPFFVMVTGRKR
ncbi:S-adenosyl-L-methionine-dependent methyltransferase [Penicillium angulare]|uniref:S-adenosyl-L-methionine-dependent methyltransferase n=1 Tax=Penicillium angulare TaxID=116970 RepID=A0A9W9KI52_9EURO|nr:S-adenosyl-L-methionine-dependent methyltransferase [Penicillium angulare]